MNETTSLQTHAAASQWSISDHALGDRFDALSTRFNELYCHWVLDQCDSKDFQARLRYRSTSGFRVVEACCDPFTGRRHRPELASADSGIVGIQLVLSGSESLAFGTEHLLLDAGDVLVWDSTRSMSFHVHERLHKVTLLMPLRRLQNWLPTSWHRVQRKLPRGSAGANLMNAFIRAAACEFLDGGLSRSEGLTEAAVGLLVNVTESGERPESQALSAIRLSQVRSYIQDHLSQPDLSPAAIASGCRISLRYLHGLFGPAGITVQQYVIQERLARCRRELSNPMMAKRKVTDIAFSWGFRNATHFAKRFKAEFGVTPQDFRATQLG